MGRVIIEKENVKRLDLSNLTNGIYNLVILHDGVRYSKKVIKQ